MIVLGYYTLSSQEIDAGELPVELKKRTGRYERLGDTLIGRLAMAQEHQGKDLGELLLLNAFHKSLDVTRTVARLRRSGRCQKRASRWVL